MSERSRVKAEMQNKGKAAWNPEQHLEREQQQAPRGSFHVSLDVSGKLWKILSRMSYIMGLELS